jgi:hypothetical protein
MHAINSCIMCVTYLRAKWLRFKESSCNRTPWCKLRFRWYLKHGNHMSWHSNDPKKPTELREQYTALMKALGLDPSTEKDAGSIQNPEEVAWNSITSAAGELTPYGTFRGCTDGQFLRSDMMKFQASPRFASALKAKGINFLVVGDLKDEWYLYSIAHPITDYASIGTNLRRYYPDAIVNRILQHYGKMQNDALQEEYEKMFGIMLSEGQGQTSVSTNNSSIDSTLVHLPIRLLHRDLAGNGFPVLRYQINWTPEQCRPLGEFYIRPQVKHS